MIINAGEAIVGLKYIITESRTDDDFVNVGDIVECVKKNEFKRVDGYCGEWQEDYCYQAGSRKLIVLENYHYGLFNKYVKNYFDIDFDTLKFNVCCRIANNFANKLRFYAQRGNIKNILEHIGKDDVYVLGIIYNTNGSERIYTRLTDINSSHIGMSMNFAEDIRGECVITDVLNSIVSYRDSNGDLFENDISDNRHRDIIVKLKP